MHVLFGAQLGVFESSYELLSHFGTPLVGMALLQLSPKFLKKTSTVFDIYTILNGIGSMPMSPLKYSQSSQFEKTICFHNSSMY
jgi:hypothetical protein